VWSFSAAAMYKGFCFMRNARQVPLKTPGLTIRIPECSGEQLVRQSSCDELTYLCCSERGEKIPGHVESLVHILYCDESLLFFSDKSTQIGRWELSDLI